MIFQSEGRDGMRRVIDHRVGRNRVKASRRVFAATAAVGATAALCLGSGAPALAQGALSHSCSAWPANGAEGVVVYTPSGGFLVNCREHIHGGGGSTGGDATTIDCSSYNGGELYGGHIYGPGMVGTVVETPSGGTYINCAHHNPPNGPPRP